MTQKKISNDAIRTGIGQRLRIERERLGLKQEDYFRLGDWSARTVSNWEAGRTTPTAEFFADVEELGLDVNFIITGRRTASPLTGPAPAPAGGADTIRIPLFSATGSMGKGNDLITEDVLMGEIPVSRHWLALNVPRSRPEALQLVHAYGDSMQGTLNSGDFAIVDTDCKVADIDGVYVLQANGQLFIKRVTRRIDGAHVITSDNPSVRTVDVLDGSQQVRICGRVVYGWNGRRF
ncbi:phage repressor protein C with HTH and peptisase S24 domain [Acidovorax sp. 62]|uniref:XRE family transcriptional regulator n=1 Tax=Acidovorax sp. 62 TaxID=2035203 RepID=UPI000C1A4CE3|nr:XRE family transcriptional regulator [Acidovorax sp. 62]PIF89761.1 phage repressor protein C with HTH and peptisase S24 domain [Acidovorax sp. 62]